MLSNTAKKQPAIKASIILKTSPENVIAYKEKPASNKFNTVHPAEMTAEKLFSFFTAEVIEKDTEFAR
jgi:hypothetical protein